MVCLATHRDRTPRTNASGTVPVGRLDDWIQRHIRELLSCSVLPAELNPNAGVDDCQLCLRSHHHN